MNCKSYSIIRDEYVKKGLSEECPIIDMHGHLGPMGGGFLPCADVERMRRSLKRAGVKRIVCSAHSALFEDVGRGNDLMQEVIDRYPKTFLGYWVVNPNHPRKNLALSKDFENTRGFVGLKFLPDYHNYSVTGGRYEKALEYADQKKLIVLVHTWGRSCFNAPQQIAHLAEKYTAAIFIMGHSGYGDWETSVNIARELPNVYLDLTAVWIAHDFAMLPAGSGTPRQLESCLQVNGIIEYMVEEASSKKILFGTDMPWYSPHFAVGAVLFSRINEDERHDILYRNAETLLGNLCES